MTYLIDTQILIWFQLFDTNLKSSIYEMLTHSDNKVYVSQISLIEIAIKQKAGKLGELDKSIEELIQLLQSDGFELMPIKDKHIATYKYIPLLPNHKDPFDRLILATGLAENLPIISADENFKLYMPQILLIEA